MWVHSWITFSLYARSDSHVDFGDTEKLVNEFVRQMYVEKQKVTTSKGLVQQYKWGMRAYHEVRMTDILQFVASIYDVDVEVWKKQFSTHIGAMQVSWYSVQGWDTVLRSEEWGCVSQYSHFSKIQFAFGLGCKWKYPQMSCKDSPTKLGIENYQKLFFNHYDWLVLHMPYRKLSTMHFFYNFAVSTF